MTFTACDWQSAGRSTGLAVVLLLSAAGASAGSPRADSFAHLVPAEVGLFVELHDAADLLVPLTDTQAWLTIAELAGQPARTEEAARWQQRVERTVGLTPVQAIETLFSRRVAFAGESLRSTQDAVILCEPARRPESLVEHWHVQRLPSASRATLYRLPYNVGLATHANMMMFGDAVGRGLFSQVLDLMEATGGPSLASDPDYQRLLVRVPPEPAGVFFARLVPPTASAPSATTELPALLQGSHNVLLALHREGNLLHFTAVGDAGVERPPAERTRLSALVDTLPERTLLAWAGHVEYMRLPQVIQALPERHLVRVAYQMHQKAGTMARLIESLESATCVAVGVVDPTGPGQATPPVPALAVLIQTRHAARVQEDWDTLVQSTISLYKLLSMRFGDTPALLSTQQELVADVAIATLDLSALTVPRVDQTPLGELHLSWAFDGDVMIVGTHGDWVRQIVRARHAATPTLAAAVALTKRPEAERRDAILVAQTGPLADLGGLWLRFLEDQMPAVLEEAWWRDYQPGGSAIQLGVQVAQDPQRQRLTVRSITPGMPAEGVLKVGDEILGCNRRRFATSQPVIEVFDALRERPDARWIDLIVERDRVVRVRRVPMPFVDPTQLLRRLIAVGRLVQRVVYHDDLPDRDGPRGHLTLELRQSNVALFPFTYSPASQPASQPVAGATERP